MGVILMLAAHLIFHSRGIWIRESQPLIGIFLSYYLVVPYRLIREYKKRWDYQRKNELLVQVEQLKTNFISLVTHDLKTPVARIQGLTEILIRRLNTPEITPTLQNILNATDELNRFITSILELSKIESDHIQLNLESKDINQIIENTTDKLSANARLNQVEIIKELEPMFPIKVDVSLISKVLSNLIDNAIRYSPAGARVVVRSHEAGDWIEISVRDQGIGMTDEEQANLFSKFYRAKNDTTTRISGTGLGLYLTKYFIEAHGGRVEVESKKGEGSVFKIYLPIHPPEQIGLQTRLVLKKSKKENPYV
jgi:signal transduction histidine kinase